MIDRLSMYFDHCDNPKELEKAIRETLTGTTFTSVTIKNPGSGFIPIIGQSEDQTLREAFLEARSRAEILRKKRPNLNLPEIPDSRCLPLNGLFSMIQWCQISNNKWNSKEPKPGPTATETRCSPRRYVGTVKLRAYRPNRSQDVGNSCRVSRTILRSFPRMLL